MSETVFLPILTKTGKRMELCDSGACLHASNYWCMVLEPHKIRAGDELL